MLRRKKWCCWDKEKEMENKERLRLTEVITAAEIYAVKVIEEELKRKGIGRHEGQIVIMRVAEVLTAHKEEVRDMYKKSEKLLGDWIIEMSGINNMKAFEEMNRLGITGDVLHDMKTLGVIQKGGRR
nr:MAG TPA: hypothetical protein [Caudoviricetes sp.]